MRVISGRKKPARIDRPVQEWRTRRAEDKEEFDFVAANMAADLLGGYGVTMSRGR